MIMTEIRASCRLDRQINVSDSFFLSQHTPEEPDSVNVMNTLRIMVENVYPSKEIIELCSGFCKWCTTLRFCPGDYFPIFCDF